MKNKHGYLLIKANLKDGTVSTDIKMLVIDLDKLSKFKYMLSNSLKLASAADRIFGIKKSLDIWRFFFNKPKPKLYSVRKYTEIWMGFKHNDFLRKNGFVMVNQIPDTDVYELPYTEIFCVVEFKKPTLFSIETNFYNTVKIPFETILNFRNYTKQKFFENSA